MNKILIALVLAVVMSGNVFSQVPVGNSPAGKVGGALLIADEYFKAKVRQRNELCLRVINEGKLTKYKSKEKIAIANVESNEDTWQPYVDKSERSAFRLEILKAKNIILERKWEIFAVKLGSKKRCHIIYQGWVNNK
jgi:hypothetical protein